MRGLDPRIPLRRARCFTKRDGRDKPGHDEKVAVWCYGFVMLLKLIALASALIPLILFVRKVFGARPTKLGAAMREAKKQIDLTITIFLCVVGAVVVFALGKLAWAWWTAV